MQISSKLMPDICWWIRNLPNNINSIRESKYVLEIFTDAFNTGWGAYSNNDSSSGFWSDEDKSHHINYLELLAVFFRT